jgi:hypothetical protein
MLRSYRFLVASAIVVGLLSTTGAATAGDPRESSGYAVGFGEVTAAELPSGGSIGVFTGRETQVINDPSDPGHMATGKCYGVFEVSAEGAYSDRGNCVYTDRDGETFSIKFSTAPGAGGTHEYTGGTGKWEGVTGSGTYEVTDLGDGAYVTTYSETVTMK